MAFIEWKVDYSVGHSLLDHDHWRLSDIINRLHDAVETDQGEEAIAAALRSLRRYVETHFAREERLLEAQGLPGAAKHIASHRRIESTLEDFENLHACSPQALDAQSLLNFLRDWLLKHVLEDDMRYRSFFERLSIDGDSRDL